MAHAIKDSTGTTTLCAIVKQAIPRKRAQKIVKQLMSGEQHIQIIGTASDVIDVSVIATAAEQLLLEAAEAAGTQIRLEAGTKYYTGSVEKAVNWTGQGPSHYSGRFTILITDSGDLA